MALINKDQSVIDHLNKEGLGVGKYNDITVTLPYTLPREIVEFEHHKYRGQSNFLLSNISNTSPHRQIPPCKYFTICGGCLLQHMSEEEYYKFKLNVLENLLEGSSLLPAIDPIIKVGLKSRRRVSLFALKKEEKIYLGFHRFRSHQIVNIDECLVIEQKLSDLISPLKGLLVSILREHQQVKLYIQDAENGIDLCFEFNSKQTFGTNQKNIMAKFAQENNIIRILNTSSTGEEILFFAEKPYVSFGNYRVTTNAKDFLQPTAISDKILLKFIIEELRGPSSHHKIADLFCGRGTLTLPLSEYFQVEGYEIEAGSLNSLHHSIVANNLSIKLFKRDLFTSPLSNTELNKYNYAVINPPRAGAKSQCTALAQSDVKKIIYVSCNPQTFVSDAQILCKNDKFKLKKITPFDQFYWSPHLEVIGVFEKE